MLEVTVTGNSLEENRLNASNAKTYRLFDQLSWSNVCPFPFGVIDLSSLVILRLFPSSTSKLVVPLEILDGNLFRFGKHILYMLKVTFNEKIEGCIIGVCEILRQKQNVYCRS